MRAAKQNKFSSGLALTFLLLIILGCDSFVGLKGKVVDENGKPIAGAKIVIFQNNQKIDEENSATDGTFNVFGSVNPIGSSSIKLTVSKDDFETYDGEFDGNKLNEEKDSEKLIVLSTKNQ